MLCYDTYLFGLLNAQSIKSANQISSLVNRKLNRSIRSINETTTVTNLALTTQNPKNDISTDNIDDYLFPDDDEPFSFICDDIEFECKSDHKCIPLESYCNGETDCADESDESSCATTPAIHFSIVTTTETTTTTTTTSTEKSTSISPVDTTKQPELNTTTLKPTTSTENNLNTTTSTEESTTLKVLWNTFLGNIHCF